MAEAMASKRAGETIESSKGKRQKNVLSNAAAFDEPLGVPSASSAAAEPIRPENGVRPQEEASIEQETAQVVDATDGDGGVHDEEEEGGVYSDVEEELESGYSTDEGDDSDEDEDSDDDSLDDGRISTPPPDRKGKGIVLDETRNQRPPPAAPKDVKGKGKAVLVEEDDSSDDSDDEVVEDHLLEDQEKLEDDPLLEVDLNNILPTRTRRRQQPQPRLPPVVGDSDSSEEDEDYVAGARDD